MPLINSPHPDAIPLNELPATAAQTARLSCYARDAYAPINYEQLNDNRLQVLLNRFTRCTDSGQCWSGRIRVTLDAGGKVTASTVYAAEVVRMATADEPPKRSRRTAKSKAESPKPDAPQFWVGQLVKIPQGARAWVDEILPDGKIAIEIEFLGKDVYPADLLTLVETEPPAPAPELPTQPTYQPGQRIRFIGRDEHNELTGTLGTVEQVGGARLLVRSDDAGLVTIGPDEVELVEDAETKRRGRQKQKAS